MARCPALALALVLTCLAPLGLAQTVPPVPSGQGAGAAFSPVVVINQERLLSQSIYGQRIQREIEAAGIALATENREIEARLTEEELALTERRATMTPEAFRPVAIEFDARVNGIRTAQEAKGRALQQQSDAAQQQFFETVFPVLIDILRARGAAVLMDNRAVLLSADGVDITDLAIEMIDTRIGEGPDGPLIDLEDTASPQDPPPQATPDTAP
jgi:Skp family chaperone for outer membrane proteins